MARHGLVSRQCVHRPGRVMWPMKTESDSRAEAVRVTDHDTVGHSDTPLVFRQRIPDSDQSRPLVFLNYFKTASRARNPQGLLKFIKFDRLWHLQLRMRRSSNFYLWVMVVLVKLPLSSVI
jgi:hypothetical protein